MDNAFISSSPPCCLYCNETPTDKDLCFPCREMLRRPPMRPTETFHYKDCLWLVNRVITLARHLKDQQTMNNNRNVGDGARFAEDSLSDVMPLLQKMYSQLRYMFHRYCQQTLDVTTVPYLRQSLLMQCRQLAEDIGQTLE